MCLSTVEIRKECHNKVTGQRIISYAKLGLG